MIDGPGRFRKTDPATSRAAAMAVRPGSMRARLLLAHAGHPGGLTDEAAAEAAGISLTSEYATRSSELARAGYLDDTTNTRLGASGMQRFVRRITTAGLRKAAELGGPPVKDTLF